MSLPRARQYFHKADAFPNPLLKSFGFAFKDYVARTSPEEVARTELYVERGEERATAGLVSYLCHAGSDVGCLIVGSAGVGKTTALRRAEVLATARSPQLRILWCDLAVHEKERPSSDVGEFLHSIQSWIRVQLSAELRHESRRWAQFAAKHARDATGVLALFGAQDADGAPPLDLLHQVLLQMDPADDIRLKLRFWRDPREGLGLDPVIVFDNCDQLFRDFQQAIVSYAAALAAPASDPESRCKTICAMRPVTFETLSDESAAHSAETIFIGPPPIDAVIEKRLRWFLDRRDGTIIEPEHEHLLGRLVHDETEQRHRVVAAVRVVAQRLRTPELMARMDALCNGSIRIALQCFTLYLMSGHLDLEEVTSGRCSDQKLFKAMMLGPQSVYSARLSFAANMFDDGEGDDQSALARTRLLLALRSPRTATEVTQTLELLFEYPSGRVMRQIDRLLDRALLEKEESRRLVISRAGETYLRLLRDFEYVQHAVIDSPVARDHLIACESAREHASIRFERVARFAAWVRSTEVEDIVRVMARDQLDAYVRTVGREGVSDVIADAAWSAAPKLREIPDFETKASAALAVVRSLVNRSAMGEASIYDRSATPG